MSSTQPPCTIKIGLDASGMLVADPPLCKVEPGREIVWQATEAGLRFKIVFENGSPAANDCGEFESRIPSRRLGVEQVSTVARELAAAGPQAYRYDVIVGGGHIDPYIIIDN